MKASLRCFYSNLCRLMGLFLVTVFLAVGNCFAQEEQPQKLDYEVIKKTYSEKERKAEDIKNGEDAYHCFLKVKPGKEEFFLCPLQKMKWGAYGLNEDSIRQRMLDKKGELFLVQWANLSQGSGHWLVGGFLILKRDGDKCVPLLHSYYSEFVRAGWMGNSLTTLDVAYFSDSSMLVLSLSNRDFYADEKPMLLGGKFKRNGYSQVFYKRVTRETNNYQFVVKKDSLLPLSVTTVLDLKEGGKYTPEEVAAYLKERKIECDLNNADYYFPLVIRNQRLKKFPVRTFEDIANIANN